MSEDTCNNCVKVYLELDRYTRKVRRLRDDLQNEYRQRDNLKSEIAKLEKDKERLDRKLVSIRTTLEELL